jgi:type VI secretion system protein ImpE
MSIEELIKEGKLRPAIAEVEGQIRDRPADAKLRVLLFNLLSMVGDWKRAVIQLETAAQMDGENGLLSTVYKPAVSAELLRSKVFSGQTSPVIFGQPDPWMGKLVQSLQLAAGGQFQAAGKLRDMALEDSPVTNCTINGKSCEWIADGDTRLGPMLEAIVNGQYYWIPFVCIKRIQIEPPVCVRDLVWTVASFVWSNGGTAAGLIPTRYSGSETSDDNLHKLSRKTDWIEKPEKTFYGVGQRILVTEKTEYPLLEIRDITFGS